MSALIWSHGLFYKQYTRGEGSYSRQHVPKICSFSSKSRSPNLGPTRGAKSGWTTERNLFLSNNFRVYRPLSIVGANGWRETVRRKASCLLKQLDDSVETIILFTEALEKISTIAHFTVACAATWPRFWVETRQEFPSFDLNLSAFHTKTMVALLTNFHLH